MEVDFRAEIARLRAANARLEALLASTLNEVAKLNERVAELLAIAVRKKGSATKKATKEPVPPPPLEGEAQTKFAVRPLAPELPPKPEKPKQKQRPTGRKPLPDHLPDDVHVVTPTACSCCGANAFDFVDEVVETKLHVIQEHQRKRVVRRKTGRCRSCGTRTTARSLPAPFERSKVTCDWLAWLVYMKFVLQVPLDRIRRDLTTRQLPLAMGFLVSQVERAADLLGAIDGEHWKQLLAGTWMGTDATGLKVLVPKMPTTHHGHLEVYRRPDVVVFQYEADKSSDTLVAKLAGFEGVLVADAEHRHNALFTSGRIIEAGCNAHGRRKLRDAEAVQPVLANEAGAFVAAIYEAEGRAHEARLTGDALRQWRQTKVPPLRDDFRRWMDAVEPSLVPSDPLAAAIRYYRNHWDALFRFVDHPEIPIDNSGSEREYQAVAKLRLNSLFAGGTEGAHRAAVLLGIAATCRALGVDPLAYMTWAFERLGTHREDFGNLPASQLTPAAYKAQKA